jgi:acyl carrier protein
MSVREEAIEILIAKAKDIFPHCTVALDANTGFEKDLGAKSANIVQFSVALEDEFDIEVPYMEFKRKKTFGEAADYIAQILN